MALDFKKLEYYNITVEDHAPDGANLLSVFASAGISWYAFKAVTLEPKCIRFSLFPNDGLKMISKAKTAGLALDGPYSAIMIKDSDESGALADIYMKLAQAGINVDESSGIADINGGYGVVLYLNETDCEKAMKALEM